MMLYEHIKVAADARGIVHVLLDRDVKRNAINAKMWRELGHAFRTIGTNGDNARCILLRGSGRSFCSGIDTTDPSFGFEQTLDGDRGEDSSEPPDVARKVISFKQKILEMQAAITALETNPLPVVAAVHGFCVGAGVDLISAADVRICSPSAVFSVREVQLGLAADIGTLQRLPKIVGHGSRVRELCLTGESFDANEARRIGLVSRISTTEQSLFQDTIQVCLKIANASPVAVYGTKHSLNYSRDHSVAEGLDHIASHNAAALMTNDVMVSYLNRASTSKKAKSSDDHEGIDGGQFDNLLPMARL